MNHARGSITRLIDVTLIILIGFLAVADLDERSALTLPQALSVGLEEMLDTLKLDERRLLLTAAGENLFLLELSSATGLNRPLGRVRGADTLRAVFARLKAEQQLASVDVEVAPGAPLQTAVDAVDACDLYELKRDVRFLPFAQQAAGSPETGSGVGQVVAGVQP